MDAANQTVDTDAVLARVRKLLALASNPGATEDEAALAAARAQAILTRYNLDMASVHTAGEPGPDVVEERFGFGKVQASWEVHLFASVAATCYCRPLIVRRAHLFNLVGRPADVLVAKELYLFLHEEVLRLRNRYRPLDQIGLPVRGMPLQALRKTFALGCASRIGQRLEQAFAARHGVTPEGEAAPAAPAERLEGTTQEQCTALVVCSKQAIDRYFAKQPERTIRPSKPTRARIHSASAFAAGLRAGNTVPLEVRRKLN